MKMVILDSFIVNPGDLDWDLLKKFGELDVYDATPPQLVYERCRDAEIIFTSRTKVTGDVLRLCPKVKLVYALGTGYEMIDIAYCREHCIMACNNPAYSSNSVAQMVFSFLLELTCDMQSFRTAARDGKWTGMDDYMYHEYKHEELSELTLGLVGCGDIGRRAAQIALGFGMRVLATTATRSGGENGGIKFLPLEEMLAQSDVVSLHCPLTEKTRGMVDDAFISMMKPGAILINTARGGILNEKALYEALKDGRISAAGLDVMATEPPGADNPLFSLSNCIITPHISWATRAARLWLQKYTERNVAAFISGKELGSRIV